MVGKKSNCGVSPSSASHFDGCLYSSPYFSISDLVGNSHEDLMVSELSVSSFPIFVYPALFKGEKSFLEISGSFPKKIRYMKRQFKNFPIIKDVPGVVGVKKTYPYECSLGYVAIRDFYFGTSFLDSLCIPDDVKFDAGRLVEDMHSLGLAGLGLKHDDTLFYSDEDKVGIANVGHGNLYHGFFGGRFSLKFRKEKDRDLRDLDALLMDK